MFLPAVSRLNHGFFYLLIKYSIYLDLNHFKSLEMLLEFFLICISFIPIFSHSETHSGDLLLLYVLFCLFENALKMESP